MRAGLVCCFLAGARALVLVPTPSQPRCHAARMQEAAEAIPFTDEQIARVMADMPPPKGKQGWEESVEDKRARAIKALKDSGLGKQIELRETWVAADGVSSWYDAGIRLSVPDEVVTVPSEPSVDLSPMEQTKISASAEASLAAGLLSGIAVLGVDIGGMGVVENLDTAVLVGGLALSQVDSDSPVGTTLRTVGNVTSTVATEVVVPTAKGVNNFVKENELGLKSRAVLELGLEAAILALNPKRKEAEALTQKYNKAAAAAMKVRAKRDEVPLWDLQTRWKLDEEVREAEEEALSLKRAAQEAQSAS